MILEAEGVAELRSFCERARDLRGSSAPIKPAHRIKFHWPPHPISYSYNVHASDWTGQARFEAYGETFDVEVARTPFGVFGRCQSIWHEDRGESIEDMLANLRKSSEILFRRQLTINHTLERPGRFIGHISELPSLDLLKLTYCEDRDVAHEARTAIEAHASEPFWLPLFIAVLRDELHPFRRIAQWCVLDLFEALPTFVRDTEREAEAVAAIKALTWDAPDDYARTIYKAGVVLGGHIPDPFGAVALIECLDAPSRIGRRSAIHGLFHAVEWMPEMSETVVSALRLSAQTDPEPILRDFAAAMANDIEAGETDHVVEPVFAEES